MNSNSSIKDCYSWAKPLASHPGLTYHQPSPAPTRCHYHRSAQEESPTIHHSFRWSCCCTPWPMNCMTSHKNRQDWHKHQSCMREQPFQTAINLNTGNNSERGQCNSPLSLSTQIGLVGAQNYVSCSDCLGESVSLYWSYAYFSRNHGVSDSQMSKSTTEEDLFYLIILFAAIPFAILGNWNLIEDRTSVRATKPFDPFHDFCARIFLGLKVFLKRHSYNIIDLASSFDHTLVALYANLCCIQ